MYFCFCVESAGRGYINSSSSQVKVLPLWGLLSSKHLTSGRTFSKTLMSANASWDKWRTPLGLDTADRILGASCPTKATCARLS